MVVISWSKLAHKDLDQIYEYIAKDSSFYARKIIERIFFRVEALSNFPESGRIVPEFNQRPLRELIEGNYRIVYRYQQPEITILRIHHSARSLSKMTPGIGLK